MNSKKKEVKLQMSNVDPKRTTTDGRTSIKAPVPVDSSDAHVMNKIDREALEN